MYSPFFDSKGSPLTIEKVRYSHLSQLKECDEGYCIEYKLLLKDDGKAQLAKEISSFANCEGGWLIIGIDDKTKDVKSIEKQDYSQRIGKIACRISPMPEFETRFLTNPNDKKTGVLIVYVYEGRNAPYICNGSVYVRSGSSKEPIKPAERGNIEYLFERSKGYKKEIEDFCKRDFIFLNNNYQKTIYPTANIYLKNISSKKRNFLLEYSNIDKIIDFINSKCPIFEHISYSINSIIFMHKYLFPNSSTGTLVFELFFDWSCKISIPIGISNKDDINDLLRIFTDLGYNENDVKKFQLASGSDLFNSLFGSMILFDDIAKEYNLKENEYIFCFEAENAGNIVVVFDGDMYKEYIKQYCIPYAHKEINKTNIIYLKNFPNYSFSDWSFSMIENALGATFGFRSDKIGKILEDSNNKKYNEKK